MIETIAIAILFFGLGCTFTASIMSIRKGQYVCKWHLTGKIFQKTMNPTKIDNEISEN